MLRNDNLDLVAAFALALMSTALIGFFPSYTSPLRVALGFLLVLFLPGYSLMAFLFPRRDDLDAVERWVVSAGLSVAAVTLTGLTLNYLPWGVRTLPVSVGLCLFVLTCALLARSRRGHISAEERFSLVRRSPSVMMGLALFIGVGAVIGSLIAVTLALRPPALSTEFYILGQQDRLENYPRAVTPGEPMNLEFGITSYEREPEQFIVLALLGAGEQLFRTPPLGYGETWQDALALDVPPGEGEVTAVFRLYRSGSDEPYRSLQLDLVLTPPDPSDLELTGSTQGEP